MTRRQRNTLIRDEVMDTAEIQHVVVYDSPTVTAPKTGDDLM